MKKKTLQDWKVEVERLHPHLTLMTYTGRNSLCDAVCSEHGAFQAYGRALIADSVSGGCPECSRASRVDGQRLTLADAGSLLSAQHPTLTLVEYAGRFNLASVVCPQHGKFSKKFADVLSASVPCPLCPSAELQNAVADLHRRLPHIRLTSYTRQDAPAAGVCERHGEFTLRNLKAALYKKSHGGCLECARQHQGGARKFDSIATQVSSLHPHLRVTHWVTHCRPALAVCSEHGEFRVGRGQVLTNRTSSGGCPACALRAKDLPAKVSKEEDNLAEWLASEFGPVERSVRTLIAPREVDIYLPGLKLGVEYHGIYHHREGARPRQHHVNKANLADKAGLRLLQVFSDEWVFQRLKVQELIRVLAGSAPRLVARKLQLVGVTAAEARAFYEQHHLQGFSGGVHTGLAQGGQLVACATVGRSRFADELELRRYATAGVAVVGGLARLMKALTHPGDVVVSYCDRRWFTGGAYLAAGFQKVGVTDPGYFWIKHAKRYSRFQFQKQNVQRLIPDADLSKTETEIATAAGFYRLWDAGHIKFRYVRV